MLNSNKKNFRNIQVPMNLYPFTFHTHHHFTFYTLSGRIGKVVASNVEGCKIKSLLSSSCTDLYNTIYSMFIPCMRRSRGTAHHCWGCDQSIGCTVSGVVIRSSLWSTETISSTLGYFKRLLQAVDN